MAIKLKFWRSCGSAAEKEKIWINCWGDYRRKQSATTSNLSLHPSCDSTTDISPRIIASKMSAEKDKSKVHKLSLKGKTNELGENARGLTDEQGQPNWWQNS